MAINRDQLNILLVDDDEDEYFLLKSLISSGSRSKNSLKVKIDWASTYENALHAFKNASYDAYLIDVNLGGQNGLDLLGAASELDLRAPIIILTGQGTYENDLIAMQEGASDFLEKDKINLPLLERSIRYAIEHKHAQEELEERVRERTAQLAAANEDLISEIALRRQVENNLRESEMKFRALADTTSAAIFIIQDNQIQYANPASKFILGYDPAELLDHHLEEYIHPAYRHTMRSSAAHTPWAGNIPVRFELKLVRKDGGERWVDLTSGQIEYEGKPAQVLTAFDITERDLAEQELRKAKDELENRVEERTRELRNAVEQLHAAATEARQHAEELEALNQATQALLSTLDLSTLLGQILSSARSALPSADMGWLYLVEPNTGQLTQRARVEGNLRKIHLPEGEENPFRSYRGKKPILLNSIPEELERVGITPDSFRPDVRSAIIAPLILQDGTIGIMALGSSLPGIFTQEDLNLLTSFSVTATSAIRNAILHSEMQRLAITDELTGRYNRRAFMEMGEREIERAKRFHRNLSALMIDIDSFKEINDTHGHAAGDIVLKVIADRILGSIREIDILGRYGGDEFAILLPESEWEKIPEIASRILRSMVNEPIDIGGTYVRLTASLGAARMKGQSSSLESLLSEADEALYRVKQTGKNHFEISP